MMAVTAKATAEASARPRLETPEADADAQHSCWQEAAGDARRRTGSRLLPHHAAEAVTGGRRQ